MEAAEAEAEVDVKPNKSQDVICTMEERLLVLSSSLLEAAQSLILVGYGCQLVLQQCYLYFSSGC